MSTSTRQASGRLWFCLMVGFAFIVLSGYVHADTRILDDIAADYKTASAGWMTTLLGYANRLFMLLATIELAWSFAVWALEKNELQSLGAALVKKIMWVGIFYALLLNGSTWIPTIVDSFVQAGQAAAGSSPGLSPTEVFNTGVNNAATMVSGLNALDLLKQPIMVIFGGLSALIMVIAFAVMAGQLLVALVESYIAVSAGVLFLGFGGSRWTTDFVQKFIGYAVATGVKLFMLYLIVGVGNAQAATWAAKLTAALGGPAGEKFNVIMSVMGGSAVLMFMAMQIPAMAASMLAGSPTLTAGGAAATAGALGAGIVGAGAGAAAATIGAAKTTGGLAQAARAAYQEAGASGASGLARAVSTLGNMGSAAGSVIASRTAQSVAPTFGGQMADQSSAKAVEKAAAATSAKAERREPTLGPPPLPTPDTADSSTSAVGGLEPAASSPLSEASPVATAAPEAPASPTPSLAAETAPGPVLSAPEGAPSNAPIGATPTSTADSVPAPPLGQDNTAERRADTPTRPASSAGVRANAEMPDGRSSGVPGLEDRLRSLQHVRPPHIPSDAAPPATVHIRFDTSHD